MTGQIQRPEGAPPPLEENHIRYSIAGQVRSWFRDRNGTQVLPDTVVELGKGLVPICFMHQHDRELGIGALERVQHGFFLHGFLCLDPNHHFDQQVIGFIEAGWITGLSWLVLPSFEDLERGWSKTSRGILRGCSIEEVSVCIIGQGADPLGRIESLRRI